MCLEPDGRRMKRGRNRTDPTGDTTLGLLQRTPESTISRRHAGRRRAGCVLVLLSALAFVPQVLANDFTGVWQGTWTSSFGGAGNLNVSLTQTGSTASGTVTITATECGTFSDLSLTGTVSGNIGVFEAFAFCSVFQSSNRLEFANATLSDNIVTGNYTIFSNDQFYDSGTFVLTRSVNIITATAGSGGTISPSGSVQVSAGANRTFNIAPNSGFVISDVLVDGVSVGAVSTFTFLNVVANHTIEARFAASRTITASAGPGGTISPSGAVSINPGASQKFTVTPDAGFIISDVLVDGSSIGAVSTFTFTNVTTDHTIEARFLEVYPAIAPALQLITDDN